MKDWRNRTYKQCEYVAKTYGWKMLKEGSSPKSVLIKKGGLEIEIPNQKSWVAAARLHAMSLETGFNSFYEY